MCFITKPFKNITEEISNLYEGFDEHKSFPNFKNQSDGFDAPLSDDELETFMSGIYAGTITVANMPFDVYKKVGDALEKAVFKGYGGSPFTYSFGPDLDMVESLRVSTWIFSGVKNATHIFEAQARIFDKEGFKRPYNEFRDEVNQMFTTRYDSWLNAEYNTAIAQSQSANQFNDFIKNGAECLMYQTVADARVRKEHATLDNIVRLATDPFWKKYYPPNGWNCRCDVIEVDCEDYAITDLEGKEIEEINPLFEGNPAIEKVVFPKSHPYFKIAKSSSDLRTLARNNFNMPIPPPNPENDV